MTGGSRGPRSAVLATAALALVLGSCGGAGRTEPARAPSAGQTVSDVAPTDGPDRDGTAPRSLSEHADAWVAVSVATLWRSPSSPRLVDAPALSAPVRLRAWLSAMTTEQRRGLSGRADTQALLGDRVRVLELSDTWAKVRVPDQPVPDLAGGYRGWVPRRQLTARPPTSTARIATVTSRTSWLRTPGTDAKRLLVSFGTRLPYLGAQDARRALVALPSGVRVAVATANVSLHRRGTPALPPTGRSLVRTAKQFVGLPYLWAGRSGFGFDCSGLTSLDYRVHGVVIPRDARPQSVAGRAVAAGSLALGDLLFYATNGAVHHVSIYAGGGTMVHSPRTGKTVEVIATSSPAYAQEYVRARRFLG
jgi:cell wall-associated NlpC family hydrolase